MKTLIKKEINDDSSDTDDLISVERMKVRMNKQFTKAQSKFIMEVTDNCSKGNKRVDWVKVARFFESDSNEEEMMKKIKYHYHNQRSLPKRVNTKKTTAMMISLGLNLNR